MKYISQLIKLNASIFLVSFPYDISRDVNVSQVIWCPHSNTKARYYARIGLHKYGL